MKFINVIVGDIDVSEKTVGKMASVGLDQQRLVHTRTHMYNQWRIKDDNQWQHKVMHISMQSVKQN